MTKISQEAPMGSYVVAVALACREQNCASHGPSKGQAAFMQPGFTNSCQSLSRHWGLRWVLAAGPQ